MPSSVAACVQPDKSSLDSSGSADRHCSAFGGSAQQPLSSSTRNRRSCCRGDRSVVLHWLRLTDTTKGNQVAAERSWVFVSR